MTSLLRAFSAELLKMKRTLALTLIFVMPLSVCFLNLAILLNGNGLSDETYDVWEFLLRNNVGFWGVLMLPLFVTLETALVAALDHNAQSWKHVYALPIPRWSVYMAKQLINLSLIAGSMIVVALATVGIAAFIQISGLLPAGRILSPVPWEALITSLSLLFLASWLMIAIHTWVSIRWQSFTVASAVGIVATVTGFLVINSETYSLVFPWSLPLRVAGAEVMGTSEAPLSLVLGLVGGIVVALLACWDVTRRDVL
jgi:hypothetical protein